MPYPDRSNDQTLGRETRAIIEAVNGIGKPLHERTTYRTIEIDLAVARHNVVYELEGWFDFLIVGVLTGAASIRINESTKDLIDLAYVKTMKMPIRRFYITNDAQADSQLVLALGGDASFDAVPQRSTELVFRYYLLDNDGGDAIFEPSFAVTDTPTLIVPQGNNRKPPGMTQGILLRVHYYMNPTNAVTYTLRIYRAGYADNVISLMSKLYQSPLLQADSVEYDEEVEIPFSLVDDGVIYVALEWTAAPGVTSGFVELTGVVKR